MSKYTQSRDKKGHDEQLQLAIRDMLAQSLDEVGLQLGRVESADVVNGMMLCSVRVYPDMYDNSIRLTEMACMIENAFTSDVTLVEISHRAARFFKVGLSINLSAQEGIIQ